MACASSGKVKIDSGVLQGSEQDGVVAFKRIPYAAAPVGNLRWEPPQPVAAWSGVRSATSFGHDCMQLPAPNEAAPAGTTTPGEDCLYLNIWAPAKRSSEKSAVLVWIHGGGFLNGGSSVPVYDGSAFARDGVVCVTFNYRLGRFGFFAHPALTKANPSGLLGNYSYMDEIAALKWVQQNIAAFGGDPQKVTIMGESVGGGSVHFLLNSPASKGLFSKGIIQSGGGRAGGSPRLLHSDATGPGQAPTGETLGMDFAKSQGITGEDSAALTALRKLSPEAIVNGLNNASRRNSAYLTAIAPAPMVDGKLIVGTPQSGYQAGTQQKVPIIVGANNSDRRIPREPRWPIFSSLSAPPARTPARSMILITPTMRSWSENESPEIKANWSPPVSWRESFRRKGSLSTNTAFRTSPNRCAKSGQKEPSTHRRFPTYSIPWRCAMEKISLPPMRQWPKRSTRIG